MPGTTEATIGRTETREGWGVGSTAAELEGAHGDAAGAGEAIGACGGGCDGANGACDPATGGGNEDGAGAANDRGNDGATDGPGGGG
jgi:hypothetical protein